MTNDATQPLPRLGIIGVGHLASYVTRGLRNAGWDGEIVLSPRGASVAADLGKACGCEVAPDNQAVVDACDIVMLAPRPAQALDALAGVTLRSEQTLLSVVAGVSCAELAAACRGTDDIVRAIPVTSAEVGASPNIYFPEHSGVARVLNACGTAIPLKREEDFDAAGVMACVYGWFFVLFDTLTEKSVQAGLDRATAEQVVLGMAKGAAVIAEAQARPGGNGDAATLARKIASPGSLDRKSVV